MTPASTLVRAGGLDPAAVGARCGVADVDAIPVRPAPAWMTTVWVGQVAAMTLPGGIYVRRDVLEGDPRRLASLLAHELVHVRQWRDLGPLRFLGCYLGGYLRARLAGRSHADAYRQIGFEREAVEATGHREG